MIKTGFSFLGVLLDRRMNNDGVPNTWRPIISLGTSPEIGLQYYYFKNEELQNSGSIDKATLDHVEGGVQLLLAMDGRQRTITDRNEQEYNTSVPIRTHPYRSVLSIFFVFFLTMLLFFCKKRV